MVWGNWSSWTTPLFCAYLLNVSSLWNRGREVLDAKVLAEHPDPESEEYIRAFVRKNAITVFHPVGTTRMGHPDDPMTVLNERLQVQIA